MIALLTLLAMQTPPSPKYTMCGVSAETVQGVREQVRLAPTFTDMPGGGEWHPRWNGVDLVWLFPDGKDGIDIAICRHLVTDANGTSMETRLICDGPDPACDAARDRLLGKPANR